MLKKTYMLSDKASKSIISGCVWMCLYNIATLLPVILLASITEKMILNLFGETKSDIPLIVYLILSLLIVLLIFFSFRITYRKKYIDAGKEGATLRMRIAEKIRTLPLSYIGKRDLSDLTATIMDDATTVEGTIATGITEFIGSLMSGFITIIILFFVDWRMAVSLSICLLIAIIVMPLSKKISEGTNTKCREKKLAISDGLQEYLENIKVIRSSPQKAEYQNNLKIKIKSTIISSILYEFIAGFSITISSNSMKLGLGLVIITGSSLLISGEISLFTFFLFLFIAVRVYEPLSRACETLGVIIFSLVSAGRIREILNCPAQLGDDNVTPNQFDVTFENVTFGYNKEDVLHNVSFVAKQGEITALVGPSGCGKSTICKLAARFWDIEKGKISIGGININQISPDTLLKNFSIVFQDVVLFNDTIYNNIKIGKNGATREEIIAAAKLARCEDFINKLPNGYETVIGENGKTLSGGERQRLSIARAFLKDAPIILLDELTASIDPENEIKIQEAIGKLIKNKTVLIIAHKLRAIEDCDKIIVIKEGQIEEMGVHNALLSNEGLYHRLYSLQKESMSWGVNA